MDVDVTSVNLDFGTSPIVNPVSATVMPIFVKLKPENASVVEMQRLAPNVEFALKVIMVIQLWKQISPVVSVLAPIQKLVDTHLRRDVSWIQITTNPFVNVTSAIQVEKRVSSSWHETYLIFGISFIGARCDVCSDNYYGNPEIPGGSCVSCNCSENWNFQDTGNCDSSSGQCLKCLFNTEGDHCEYCQAGFFGDAVQGQCEACVCNILGTDPNRFDCDRFSGECHCLPNVEGRECDR